MDFKSELTVTRDNLDNYLAEQPHGAAGFAKLQKAAMTEGALSFKHKELIALAIGIARQCSDCIGFHTAAAIKAGATKQEVAETVTVSMLMGGGPAYMYGARALEAYDQFAGVPEEE
ncbi:MAG: carboxymuconolactone decarboxylase family protein [Paracoccaceae bacterium]